MIKVAFNLIAPGDGWLGGVNYFWNLFDALYTLPEREIQPVVLVEGGELPARLRALPQLETLHDARTAGGLGKWVRKGARFALGRDALLGPFLARNGVSLLSHSIPLGVRGALPSIGWVPDFQHKRLPQYFSRLELALRDREFQGICAHSTRLIVSSRAAQRDLERFYPKHAHKARVLHFAVPPKRTPDLPTLDVLRQKYRLPERYFYAPNQFWAHKNHAVVVDALAHIKRKGEVLPHVVFSGNTQDARNPGHFELLQRRIAESEVGAALSILGLIPFEDVLGLAAHAIAVINPSRFEGWSTTVEEAKALGKPLILSDIDVHREQTEGQAAYFNPDDPTELARILCERRDATVLPLADGNAAAEARLDFARTYQEIALETLAAGPFARRNG